MYLNNYQKIFCVTIFYSFLYYISSTYMYTRHDPNLLATGYDTGRYLNLSNFFAGRVGVAGENSSWHLYFTYTLFITILEKLNLIKYYVEVQYLIFYVSSILFYKSLKNFNFSNTTTFLSTIFIVCNPFIVFWIHVLNHAGITISLFMISFYFLSKYDCGKLFKIFFFIFIFLTLKVDGKVFFTIFTMLFYKFYLIEQKKPISNLLILISFFIIYFIYLSKFAVTLAPFSDIYLQTDLIKNNFNFIIIDEAVMKTYNKCLINEFNSLRNHFCALLDNPIYSMKVFITKFIILLTWINAKLSFKYNFFAIGMMFFLYFGLFLDLYKNRFTRFKFFLISAYLLTIVIVLPYLLRGDQKQVFYGMLFITPLCFSGYEILFKYFKKKATQK